MVCQRETTTHTSELQQVEDDDGARDEQGLTRLDAIDSSQDIDGVGAEDCEHSHVDVVENTCRGSRNELLLFDENS